MKSSLLIKIHIFSFFYITLVSAKEFDNKSFNLFEPLLENKDWVFDKAIEKITISKKSLFEKDLFALKVQKKTLIPPILVQKVLKDINNYDQFLSNSETIKSFKLDHSDSWIDAYQNISSNVPFLSDREYCFRISSEKINDRDSKSIIHWYLLDQNQYDTSTKIKSNDAIYLNFGAGLWLAEKQIDGSNMISYVVFIDPGGSIPNFVIEKANKVSVVTIFEDILNEAGKRLVEVEG